MGLDFDLKTFCQNLKATKPPYECPIRSCGKVYKSFNGIQFHLYNYDHNNPDGGSGKTPGKKGGRGRWPRSGPSSRTPSPPSFSCSPSRETMSYAESQRVVEMDIDGQVHRLNIYEPLDIIPQDEIDNCDNTEKEEQPQKPVKEVATPANSKTPKSKAKVKTKEVQEAPPPQEQTKLPEAMFKFIEDYVKPPEAPVRPASYYRFIEKTVEELDEEVEYDMDEEDFAWLELVNEDRKENSLASVSQETFEVLMDRFEKEAFFQSQTSGKDLAPSIDEDAVCSICMDGECQNSNVILFCDMCNLAVHQECYGVPYIPEGQWLCRRCLQSPSRSVDCCLCPNKGGAFKQTDDNRWAHVVCALWIPEVGFANTVFLEPIDSIQNIPAARWKLTCYVCKQRSSGACIQCHKTNCYTAFHVTCAQQAGLYMKIEPVREPSINGTSVSVRKTAFCDVHMPPDQTFQPMIDNGVDDDDGRPPTMSPEETKAKARMKMRKARKILAEKRNATPTVSIPVIPQQRLTSIASSVSIPKKTQFIDLMQSYWTLKRQSRNGVPLLRRLQSNHMARSQVPSLGPIDKNDKESNALKAQLKYWQRLRQDLEKARLLVELIRKREKLKREQLRLHQMSMELQLQPFNVFLKHTLDQLEEKDTGRIFSEPVSLEEVPDYLEHINEPMDFSAMRKKLENHEYEGMDNFEKDFELMVSNCMAYNAKDTLFYRAAIKMRDQGGLAIRAVRRTMEDVGYDQETGMHSPEKPPPKPDPVIYEDVDSFLPPEVRENMALEDQLRLLLDKLDVANAARPNKKSRFAKQIKREIIKVRRQLALQKGQDSFLSDPEDKSTASDTAPSEDELDHSPSPKEAADLGSARRRGRPSVRYRKQSARSDTEGGKDDEGSKQSQEPKEEDENKSADSQSQTPTGVNRRTSVLFSKKSQKRQRRESDETPCPPDTPLRKGPGRPPKTKLLAPPSTDSESSRTETSCSSTTSGSGEKKLSADSTECQTAAQTPSSRKRSATVGSPCPPPDNSESSQPAAKRSISLTDHVSTAMGDGPSLFGSSRKDSFLQYRSLQLGLSDMDSSSESGSTDTSMSDSDSTSKDCSSDTDGGDPASKRFSKRVRKRKQSGDGFTSEEDEDVVPLEPLDLVWAKCRGYPWYPALIINPKMPKTGYFHNGVPIPVPPEEVLALQRKHDIPVYLVLFFDTKRTWQWLPRTKLEPLGVDSGLDKAKLLENKKPNVRKAVRKAYEKAVLHRCKVTGEPNPLSSPESGSDE